MVCENIFTAPPRPNGCRWCSHSWNSICHNFLGESKSRRASKSHNWFKRNGDFAEWVDFTHWWSFIGKGLFLQPAQQACFLLDIIFIKYVLSKALARHSHCFFRPLDERDGWSHLHLCQAAGETGGGRHFTKLALSLFSIAGIK